MNEDSYFIEITVTSPTKIGAGFSAYLKYIVKTKTNRPEYETEEFEVNRRFREFHALYENLVDLYREKGVHIPHPPEKSMTTILKVKAAKTDPKDITQIEIRRHALEIFINRIGNHPVLSKEPIFIHFISALCANIKGRDNLIKIKHNLYSALTLKSSNITSVDNWYEETERRIINIDENYQKIYSIALDIYSARKDIIFTTQRFVDALQSLRTHEFTDCISKSFENISTCKSSIIQIQHEYCENEILELVGNTKSYLDDLISIKHLFSTYAHKFNERAVLQAKIVKLKDKHATAQRLGEESNINSTLNQLNEAENQLTYTSNSFDEFYNTMKDNFNLFEKIRVKDTRASFLRYLKKEREFQEEVLELWQTLLTQSREIK